MLVAAEPSSRTPRGEGLAESSGSVVLRLPYRAPFDADGLFRFFEARAVPGVEACTLGSLRRTLALPHGAAIVELTPETGAILCRLDLQDRRDTETAMERCRRLLDLDADPARADELLARDPVLAPLVARTPGRRVPGHVDGWELAVRAVLGQQVSVAGARTLAGRLVARFGATLPAASGALTHLFVAPMALADLDPSELPLPKSRGRSLVGLARAVADGSVSLQPGADPDQVERELLALHGIGPWTVAYVRMRAFNDPDAFMPTDLGVIRAAERLGLPTDPAGLTKRAERWRPWRAYATQHLWASLATPEARG